MIRTCVCLKLKVSYKEEPIEVFCERFSISSTGYIAIDYFDGGYNCVYKAEQLVSATMVRKESIFKSEEQYLAWRRNFNLSEAEMDDDFIPEDEEEYYDEYDNSEDFSIWDSLNECK